MKTTTLLLTLFLSTQSANLFAQDEAQDETSVVLSSEDQNESNETDIQEESELSADQVNIKLINVKMNLAELKNIIWHKSEMRRLLIKVARDADPKKLGYVKWKDDVRDIFNQLQKSINKINNETTLAVREERSLNKEILSKEISSAISSMNQLWQISKDHKIDQSVKSKMYSILNSIQEITSEIQNNESLLSNVNSAIANLNIKSKKVLFQSANHACYSVMNPGDIILRKALLIDGNTDNDFGKSTMGWINFLETVKGNDNVLSYRHTEIVTQLDSYNNIVTKSYYPWQFNLSKPQEEKMPLFLKIDNEYSEYSLYRTKYTAVRVRASSFSKEISMKEDAIHRAKHDWGYSRVGVCSDFVNWTYKDRITSDWNRVPILKQLIQMVYPFEAVQTPDNIADSYMTEKVCDVEKSELTFPKTINVAEWAARMSAGIKSKDANIKKHASDILKFMQDNGVIDLNGSPIVDEVVIDTPKY